ncbi:hypothetical protein HZA97_03140 [Candidatus Woesearchaeota archaeon]|nr:hypothetical protein [Candidatus Woesearchaeota archaeon]
MFKKVSLALVVIFSLNGCATLQDYDRRLKESMQNSASYVQSMFGKYTTYEIHDPANKELPLLVAGKYGVNSINFNLEVYDLTTKAFVYDDLVEQVIKEEKKPLEVELFRREFSLNHCNSERMFRIIKNYDLNKNRIIEMDEVKEVLEKRINKKLKTKEEVVEETNKIIEDANNKYKIWILSQATYVSLYASGNNKVKQMERGNSEINVEQKGEKLFFEIKNNNKPFLYVHDLRENNIVGYEGVNIETAINRPEELLSAQKYEYSDTDNKNEYLEALVDMRDYQAEIVKNKIIKN